MISRPPRSTRTDTLFPTRRSSDLEKTVPSTSSANASRLLNRIDDPLKFRHQIDPLAQLILWLARLAASLRCLNLRRCRASGCRSRHRPVPTVIVARGSSEEHTSELQSLMRISYAVFCLKKKRYKK